jgi:hypothetical protein
LSIATPLGDFGAPPDAVAWTALFLALLALSVGLHPALARLTARAPDRLAIFLLAIFAAVVSWVYVVVYLRGNPRIVDATTYYLQARALSEGHLTFDVLSPSASFRGRFSLPSPDGHSLAGIFPPGYPAVLALGFLAGAPLLVGPLIAAALVVATYLLTERVFEERAVALLAAALSAVCGVLRYHTADTMSHGWSALLFVLAIWSALGSTPGSAFGAGICSGWLVATRPVTGALALLLAAASARGLRRVGLVLLGALAPVALFFVEQHAVTGAWFRSSQAAYYALADGPPGCFRYGFGNGIGCVFEHGDFVRAHLAQGYGFFAAAGTTLRRLKMHLADAGNCELFTPLLVCGAIVAARDRRARVAVLAVAGTIVAYVPFYFDGNYPGGGARFFADVLPFEHALLAFTLFRMGLVRIALPVALTGFALHTAYDHERLASREGGRPMFEPSALQKAGVDRGLVFVDTDHGFALGHDPRVRDARDGVVVARRRHDANDVILWERLGRPPAFAYELSLAENAPPPALVAFVPQVTPRLRFEAEAQWPPLFVEGGSVQPIFPPCASAQRALALGPDRGKALHVRLDVALRAAPKYRISAGWVTPASGRVDARVTFAGIPWRVDQVAPPGTCTVTWNAIAASAQVDDFIEISSESEQALDYLEVEPAR